MSNSTTKKESLKLRLHDYICIDNRPCRIYDKYTTKGCKCQS